MARHGGLAWPPTRSPPSTALVLLATSTLAQDQQPATKPAPEEPPPTTKPASPPPETKPSPPPPPPKETKPAATPAATQKPETLPAATPKPTQKPTTTLPAGAGRGGRGCRGAAERRPGADPLPSSLHTQPRPRPHPRPTAAAARLLLLPPRRLPAAIWRAPLLPPRPVSPAARSRASPSAPSPPWRPSRAASRTRCGGARKGWRASRRFESRKTRGGLPSRTLETPQRHAHHHAATPRSAATHGAGVSPARVRAPFPAASEAPLP